MIMGMLRPTDPPAHRLLSPPVLLGSMLLVGFAPFARGTFGSVLTAGLALILLLFDLPHAQLWLPIAGGLAILSWLTGRAVLQDRKLGKDPGWFVLDESAGVILVMALIGAGSPLDILSGLLTFRLYDIAKPWPVRVFEQLPGSLGILTDDLAAAVFAAWTLWALRAVLAGLA